MNNTVLALALMLFPAVDATHTITLPETVTIGAAAKKQPPEHARDEFDRESVSRRLHRVSPGAEEGADGVRGVPRQEEVKPSPFTPNSPGPHARS